MLLYTLFHTLLFSLKIHLGTSSWRLRSFCWLSTLGRRGWGWGAQLAGNASIDYSGALGAFPAAVLRSSRRLAASCSAPLEARAGRRGLRRGRSSAPLLHVRGTPPGPRSGNFPFFETPHCLSSETPDAGKQALRPFPVLLGLVGGGRDLLDSPVADQSGGPGGDCRLY